MIDKFVDLMRLLIINPNISEVANERIKNVAALIVKAPNKFEVVSANSGIKLIETVTQSDATVSPIISLIKSRQHEFDGIIIAAFSDPGLGKARKFATCPIFGISESAMRIATQIADRFTIITVGAALCDSIRQNAKKYGFVDNLAAIRILPLTAAQVCAGALACNIAFEKACEQAILEDDIGSIIIGGGPFAGIADSISKNLMVPVLDGVQCAIELAFRCNLKAHG